MIEQVQERVEVILRFRLTPQVETEIYKIRWRGKEYTITKQAYHYKVWDGRTRLHKFAVSSKNYDLRLTYNTENLFWILEEISDGI
jgi:hypothetical protein